MMSRGEAPRAFSALIDGFERRAFLQRDQFLIAFADIDLAFSGVTVV